MMIIIKLSIIQIAIVKRGVSYNSTHTHSRMKNKFYKVSIVSRDAVNALHAVTHNIA